MARLIAHFLPQYQPNDFNNKHWGPGFTEWTNVALSRSLFNGHQQPQIPGELGFYDLRCRETRIQQEKLAKDHGIEGFVIWDYWLGDNTRLLDDYLRLKLDDSTQNLPFCIAWANHDWKGVFFGSKSVLIEQKYLGIKDYEAYFFFHKKTFLDARYMKVHNRPIFYIYRANDIPDLKGFVNCWNDLCRKHLGTDAFHFISEGNPTDKTRNAGIKNYSLPQHRNISDYRSISWTKNKVMQYIVWRTFFKKRLSVYKYEDAASHFLPPKVSVDGFYPVCVPGWDTTPRLGRRATILTDATPEAFERHVQELFSSIKTKGEDNNLVFIKSWNEWAEGNYLEPCWQYQDAKLKVIKKYSEKYNELHRTKK